MKRSELEHILRASAAITGASEFVVIGSQAILGQYPDAPSALVVSMEVDVFSLRSPKDAESWTDTMPAWLRSQALI
jgi:hypothetical protein